MAQPKVSITIQNGGLATTGTDGNLISGLVFYNTNYSLLSATTGIVYSASTYSIGAVGSTIDAENLGISTSLFPIEHYQINEYFIANPNAYLYFLIAPTGATHTFTEVTTLQQYAIGAIVRFGVVDHLTFDTGNTNLLQGIVTSLYNINMPAVIYYQPNSLALSYLTLPNLRLLTNNQVSVVISQDSTSGAGTGGALANTYSKTVSNIGQILGSKTLGVELNVGWVGGFNLQHDLENITLQIGNTQLKNIPNSSLDTLNDYGYIFMKQIVGYPGTYLNDMPSASVLANNDYAYMPNSEVMYKAVRGVRAALTPFINSKVKVNANGTMNYAYVKLFQSAAESTLNEMVRLEQISGMQVFIDPATNIVSTGQVNVTIKIQPVGYARLISVSIGFAVSLG